MAPSCKTRVFLLEQYFKQVNIRRYQQIIIRHVLLSAAELVDHRDDRDASCIPQVSMDTVVVLRCTNRRQFEMHRIAVRRTTTSPFALTPSHPRTSHHRQHTNTATNHSNVVEHSLFIDRNIQSRLARKHNEALAEFSDSTPIFFLLLS